MMTKQALRVYRETMLFIGTVLLLPLFIVAVIAVTLIHWILVGIVDLWDDIRGD